MKASAPAIAIFAASVRAYGRAFFHRAAHERVWKCPVLRGGVRRERKCLNNDFPRQSLGSLTRAFRRACAASLPAKEARDEQLGERRDVGEYYLRLAVDECFLRLAFLEER